MVYGNYFVYHLVLFAFNIKFNDSLYFPLNGGGYIIFVILGYLLFNIEVSKKYRYYIYALGIISVLFRYWATYYLSISNGMIIRTFFSYTQFHSVLLATSIFVCIKYFNFNMLYKYQNIIQRLSSCSLGIYLIHRLVMNKELYFLHTTDDNILWRVFGAFLTYMICLLIVVILKKIPYVKILVP